MAGINPIQLDQLHPIAPLWSYLLSAVQAHTQIHCKFTENIIVPHTSYDGLLPLTDIYMTVQCPGLGKDMSIKCGGG